jgi:hypothetical protein
MDRQLGILFSFLPEAKNGSVFAVRVNQALGPGLPDGIFSNQKFG